MVLYFKFTPLIKLEPVSVCLYYGGGYITCLNNFLLIFNLNFIIYEVIDRISFMFVHACVYSYSFLQQTELICSFFFNWWDDPLNYSCKVVLFSCFSNKLIESHPYSGIRITENYNNYFGRKLKSLLIEFLYPGATHT